MIYLKLCTHTLKNLTFTTYRIYSLLCNRLEIRNTLLSCVRIAISHDSREWFMSRNIRIMCWNIDRERRERRTGCCGRSQIYIAADVALLQVNGIVQGSKLNLRKVAETYWIDDGYYEFGKHQTLLGERWLNGDIKTGRFTRGNGVTGISPGCCRIFMILGII